jgi:hypothetical protein
MAASIANAVFDAALTYIKSNTNKVQVVTSASAVLVSKASGITSADFGSIASNAASSGGGRKLPALTGSDFQGLAVSTPGAAYMVRLLATSAVLIVASIASAPKSLGSGDQVNIGSFSIILKDPTP